MPHVVVIAGPNGAGKSSAAPSLLQGTLGVDTFVNADVIAQGLSGFAPESAAVRAGRIMLAELDELARRRKNFAFETTLSGRVLFARWKHWLSAGYAVHLVYLWLPSAEMAVHRVRQRVRAGGHDVPEEVIRRRYGKSLSNFAHLYRGAATTWHLYDGSAPDLDAPVAHCSRGVETIVDAARWEAVQEQLSTWRENMIQRSDSPDADIGRLMEEYVEIDKAIERAHASTILRHRQLGVPMVVWRDGQVCLVSADEISLPGEKDPAG